MSQILNPVYNLIISWTAKWRLITIYLYELRFYGHTFDGLRKDDDYVASLYQL